jgi:flagellin FlaB
MVNTDQDGHDERVSDQRDGHRRAQIGAGTILILIAVLIVAATTAGVLFDVTDLLRAEAETTQQGVSGKVTNPLEAVAVTGRINTSADPVTLQKANFIVSATDPHVVALDEATVRLETRRTSHALQYTSGDPVSGERFAVEPRRDADGSAPILNDGSDRFAIVVSTPPLRAQEWVRIRITTERGATETINVRVPRNRQDSPAVYLK